MAGKTYRIAKMAISLFSLLLLFYTTAHAKIIYVDDDGPADFDNIQAAIDDSNHGDIIIVSPGTYTGAGNRDIDYNGKAITVRSEDPNDPTTVTATIINCNGTEIQPHRGFLFNSGEEANSVLAGLTITNGYADYGGGIYCEGSRPTITNCNIVGNEALLNWRSSSGGGISCRFCFLKGPSLPGKAFDPYPSDGVTGISPTRSLRWTAGFLAESHDVYFGTTSPPPFIGNQTSTTFDPVTMDPYTTYYWRVDELNTLGKTIGDEWSFTTGPEPPPPPPPPGPPPPPPGAFGEQSSPQVLTETNLPGPTISNCIFISNGAYEGGGIYTQNSGPIFSNCTFGDNDADDGGGMFTDRSNPALLNCTFIGNSSVLGGGLLCANGNTMLTNCSFSGNSSHFGGGVFNSYGSNTTLTNCIFNDNSAKFSGGGIYNDESSRSNLTNCTFTGNMVLYDSFIGIEGGGGIYNYNGTSNLIDCKFIGNSSYRGGGMLNLGHTDISLTGCVFIENSADGYGGGLYNNANNTTLTYCIFSKNSAGDGGGMYNVGGSTALTKCMFNGNSAVLGGGMYNGPSYSTTMTNCLFSGNSAESQYSGPVIIYPPVYGYGGGIYDGYGGTKVINCSFNENRATGEGGAIWLKYPLPPPVPPFPFPSGVTSSDTMTEIPATMDVNDSNVSLISNCIIWGNQDSNGDGELSQIRIDPNEIPVVINYSCIQGWSGNIEGTGNIDADPCFVQPGFWDVIWSYRVPEYVWYEGHFQLLPESLCIDVGDPNYIAEPNEMDLDGRPRIVGGRIDMGAYEYQGPGHERLFYVDDDATGENNGSSWADAYNYLQDAIVQARYGDTILVAQGVYKPDRADYALITPGNCHEFFWLRNGVSIIGGYAGANAPDPNDRDIGLYETILSGDLDGNDVQVNDPCDLQDERSRFGNSLRVLFTYGADVSTVLDGLTIYGGYYSGMTNDYGCPTICNCTFIGNGGDLISTGMYNYESSPAVNNCKFTENNCGMQNRFKSSPSVTNCTFTGNSDDGGMYNLLLSDPILSNCLFSGNKSSENGGALQNYYLSNPTLINCTISGNWAGTYGGGMYNFGSDAKLLNCILWDNSAEEGKEIYLARYINSRGTVYPSTMDVNYSDIMGGYTNIYVDTDCTLNWGPGNIDADPCFVKPGYWDVVPLQLPDKTSDPYPFDGQESVALDTYLYWTSGFGATSHDVYFGTSNPPLFIGNQTSTIFDPPTLLVNNTKYYWRIDEINILGKTIGDVWSFTTGSLADKASNPNPANYATNVDLNAALIWTAGSGATSHDVYFGTSNPPAFIGNQIYTIFDPGTMDYYTTYFWRIDELNTVGIATGDIWRFTTRAEPPPPPPPPPPAPPAEIATGTDDVVQYIWIDGDYHLQLGSPCIDAGNPDYIPEPNETDLDGRPRIIGGRIDMGAYEYFSPRPVADAGPDQIVECACNTEEGTKVTLDGTGSYDEGDNPLTFTWTGPFVESPVQGPTPTVTLEGGCPGEYVITLVVNNGIEDSEPNDVVITVVDTTPPEFSLTVSPAMLWPPDHKMVEITPSWTVSDECDAAPQVSIVGIVANEGDDTIGVGHTSNDIQIGEDGSIYLRAERSGIGSDRVYTITYQAVDDSGNTTVRSATVSIPHDFKVLAGIASRWLWTNLSGRIPEDLNGDGVVNFTDFAKFAENWIK